MFSLIQISVSEIKFMMEIEKRKKKMNKQKNKVHDKDPS